jgi:hypothetical protein
MCHVMRDSRYTTTNPQLSPALSLSRMRNLLPRHPRQG